MSLDEWDDCKVCVGLPMSVDEGMGPSEKMTLY